MRGWSRAVFESCRCSVMPSILAALFTGGLGLSAWPQPDGKASAGGNISARWKGLSRTEKPQPDGKASARNLDSAGSLTALPPLHILRKSPPNRHDMTLLGHNMAPLHAGHGPYPAQYDPFALRDPHREDSSIAHRKGAARKDPDGVDPDRNRSRTQHRA